MVGPMARTVADLTFATRTMIDLATEDDADRGPERIMPIPWRRVELPKKLRVGYFTECGGVRVGVGSRGGNVR
jgi:Asp-tRNA(Asn)/Glu-tRNA(Gln) amidotransferase A subunit family amidase